MALETGTYISDLVSTNPVSSDPKSQGDDHIRLVKATVKASFPNVSGAVTPTHTELNYVDGVTSAIQTQIDTKGAHAGQAWTGAQDFTGATATATTQALGDSSTKLATTAFAQTMQSPAFTGTPTAPTATAGTATTQLATTAFVSATSFSTNLPGQTSNDYKVLSTDGANAGWYAYLKSTVMRWADGTDVTKLMAFNLSGFTTGTTRTLTVRDENITIAGATSTDALKIYDYTDATKKAVFQASGITTATTRTYTLADNNATIDTPGWRLLSVVTAANSATVDVESTFDSTYDKYVIEVSGLTVQTDNTDLYIRLKISGSYLTTNEYNYHSMRLTAAVTPVSAQAQIIAVTGLSNGAAANAHMRLTLASPSSTAFQKTLHYDGMIVGTASLGIHFTGGGGTVAASNGALTGVRFMMSSGNIVAGTFKLYGLRKSI